MLPLSELGEKIAIKRKTLGLTQPALAKKARVGLSTLDALENGRAWANWDIPRSPIFLPRLGWS